MSKADEYRQRLNAISNRMSDTINDLQKGENEAGRVAEIARNSREILDDLDRRFCEETGLTDGDVALLFLAVGLQIARQYLLTGFKERLDDKEAADKVNKGKKTKSIERIHSYYNPSLEEIIANPVPFDAVDGSDGILKGGGKQGHRAVTLGHDPILGIIFGTANIATSTLTLTNFESYHIKTGNRDMIKEKADTKKVFKYTMNKLLDEGIEGKKKIAYSLYKEVKHLQSDVHSKNSLPLPIINTINPTAANYLVKMGVDMENVLVVSEQAMWASFINIIIAMLHGLGYDGESDMDLKLYEVRTRKIITYSNIIASASNLVYVFVTDNFDKLDLGGIAVAIYNLITSKKFIREVKDEFIFGNFKKMIESEEYSIN